METQSKSLFPHVADHYLDQALEQSLVALRDPETPGLLATFYNPASDYVGRSFVDLEPRDPHRVTSSDLMAVSMMSIKFPARAVRRLLEDQHNQAILSKRLQALPEGPLQDTTDSDFQDMSEFYMTVKPLLEDARSSTSNRWVTASKLVARKRPDLFPVRDSVVCGFLGILPLNDFSKDWVVFRHVMQDEGIVRLVADLSEAVHGAAYDFEPKLDEEPLRLLDAALWTYARADAETEPAPEL